MFLRIDGASRGNPGPAGAGVVIARPSGRVLAERGEFLGLATNNVAEYRALLLALEMAAAQGASNVEILTDSELLVRQVTGEYRVRSSALEPLHAEAARRLRAFGGWTIRHVPRTQNARADRLANQAIDAAHADSSRTPR